MNVVNTEFVLGWMIAECANLQKQGVDISQEEAPRILSKLQNQLLLDDSELTMQLGVTGTITDALNIIRQKLLDDSEYAYGWQSNLAMCIYDQMPCEGQDHLDHHQISNDIAIDFMNKAFSLDLKLIGGDK